MPNLNAFNGDAFSMVSLTNAINDMPPLRTKLSEIKLFEQGGVNTTELWVERRHGDLRLIPTSPRGAPSEQIVGNKRDALKFRVPHISLESTIYSDEVQDIRQFGTSADMETSQSVVNDRMAKMRRQIEATWEHLRIGALRGQILDADGSVLYDLNDEFNSTQSTQTFAFSDVSAKIRTSCLNVVRAIEDELGVQPHDGVVAICGSDFFDQLIEHPDVRDAYSRYQNGEMLRNDPRKGFVFANILFIEYRAKADGNLYLDPSDCYAFPTGTPLFIERFSPADFLSEVNQMGAPLYSRVAVDQEFDRWAKVHVQSNPLPLVTRPSVVQKIEMG